MTTITSSGMPPEWVPGQGASLKPSWPKTANDALPVSGGRKFGEVPTAEVTAWLVARGVPGAGHDQGRSANSEHYATHLAKLRAAAGDAAVAAWLAEGPA